ncbi:MAG: hypothetical protein PUF24_06030 [Oribacterium sp.]|nr:hypothetical protein [Oribacterium sp.]
MRKHSVQKIMKKTAAYTVLLSCLTTNILVAPMTAYAGQATADVDETLYLNLDYYGNVSDANVVKGINFNGTSSYTDFGDYLKITNMTDEQKPEIKNGSITFEKNKNGKFFFQGELKPDKIKAPWTFDITYKLNGVVTDADKIAGASGLVEMDIDCTPNKSVSKYMQDNMMLFVAIPVDIQKCYSVDAPESQTMTLGQYTGIVFTALPGQEGHFQVRLGTDQFESVGAIFAMTPGTVGALNKIKDLKDIKDDFRDDTNAMLDDFDNVLDDVTDVSAQLKITNQILEQLQSGKNKIHGNAQVIFDGNDVAIQDLRDLNGTLTSLNDDLKTAQWMVYDVNQNLNTLDSDLMDSSAKLKSLSTKLKRLGSSMSGTSIDNLQIQDMEEDIKKTTSSLNSLNNHLNTMTDKDNLSKFNASASEVTTNAALSHVKNHTSGSTSSSNTMEILEKLSSKMGTDVSVGSDAYKTAVEQINALNAFGVNDAETVSDLLVELMGASSQAEQQEILTPVLQNSTKGKKIIADIEAAAGTAQQHRNSQDKYVQDIVNCSTKAVTEAFGEAKAEAKADPNVELGTRVITALSANASLAAMLNDQKTKATITVLATALQNMGIDTPTIVKAVGEALPVYSSGDNVVAAKLAPYLATSPKGKEVSQAAVTQYAAETISAAYKAEAKLSGSDSAYVGHLSDLSKLQEDAKALGQTAVGKSTSALAEDVNNLTSSMSGILEDLAEPEKVEELVDYINSVTSDLNEIMENGGAVAFDAAKTLNTLRSVISDIDELIGIMNAYYNDVQKTLEDSENVLTQIQKTSGDAATALQNLNSTLRSAEPDFSAAADNSFKVGHMAIDNTNKIVDDTKDFKSTGRNLRDTINNKLDEEEADNNFLNMDPEATKVSLTSDQNQEPTSIAIICRSDEISVDDDTTKTLDAEVPDASTTLLGRIKAVFVKLWNTVRSLLGMDD